MADETIPATPIQAQDVGDEQAPIQATNEPTVAEEGITETDVPTTIYAARPPEKVEDEPSEEYKLTVANVDQNPAISEEASAEEETLLIEDFGPADEDGIYRGNAPELADEAEGGPAQ